jgi:allantoinase
MSKRTVITGGIVGNPEGVYRADIVIQGERIAALTTDASDIEADERIDASGLLVVPGGVDAHTHFRDPDPNEVEGFYTGSLGAIAGGITSVVEMPQATPVSTEGKHIRDKVRDVSQKSIVDFALWGAAVNQDLSLIDEMIAEGIVGVKSFMPGSSPGFPKITDASMLDVFELLADTDIPYGLHCENDDMMQTGIRRMQEAGRNDPMAHAESRPPIVEAEAINQAIFYAEATGGIAYICHTSTSSGLQLVAEAKARGRGRIFAETCPQYLALDHDDLKRLGPFARCAPAIRAREEVELLWFTVYDETMDVISSDHCGFTIEVKEAGRDNIWEAPLGLSGVQTMFPAMLDEFINKRDLDVSHFVRLTSANPARIFSLYPRKGVLRPGSDADVVLYDPNAAWVARGEDMLHRNKWTPFEGKTITSRVMRTIIRGETVYQFDGEHRVSGEAGHGRFLPRGYGQGSDA